MTPSPPALRLSELVGDLGLGLTRPGADPLVRGLAYDSRKVHPGDLFVCVRGGKDDGHRYAAEAVRRGAVAVLAEGPLPSLDGVPQVTVADSRREMARLAARFHGEPSARLHLTGVTGTEGKETRSRTGRRRGPCASHDRHGEGKRGL